MFFLNLDRFNENVAIISGSEEITYRELAEKINNNSALKLPFKSLVFIKASNDLETIVAYLSNLVAGNIVYLYDSNNESVVNNLIDIYNPNYLFENGEYTTLHSDKLSLHSETVLLLSTSGSTGTPKFVRLTGSNIDSNAAAIADYLELRPSDRALLHLKLHYSFGLSILNSYMSVGASVVITNTTAMDESFGKLIKKHNITSFSGVPFIFQALDKASFDLSQYPSLRQITQAGGKMFKDDVLRWSKKSIKNEIEFFVMYGQTEAAPRMSYLPPKYVEQYPDSIGVAIPNGEILLVDDKKNIIREPNVEGELVYRGPNVMQGYASSLDDLSKGKVVSELYTGDIAKFNELGLFTIVGRSSRFVKLFGIRINLDDLEEYFNSLGQDVICTGDDTKIIVAHTGILNPNAAISKLSKKINIPETCFQNLQLKFVPTLSNDKVDYKAIKSLADKNNKNHFRIFKFIFTKSFWKDYFKELFTTLGFLDKSLTVKKLFFREFPDNTSETASFKDLGGDSMTYVTISMELDEIIGFLPERWESLSIKDLIELESKGGEL
ncbi:AMP-binding protein [Pseudoalteromonas sp. C8]|uniref:AMP-binding protein n=1 Tax=Pseudoalteromonas sp. C8 TaxID=2686345 RepID=UPI0013FE3769|nr:AMP-binding protein [Pseudoalteromonas sp. C8]